MTTLRHNNHRGFNAFGPILVLCCAVLLMAGITGVSSADATGLPPEILKDKYELIVERHLAAGANDRAADYMARLAHLRDEYNIELEEGFDFKRARIHYQLRQFEAATNYVTDYLAKTGKTGRFYEEALSLLVDAESAAEDISQQHKVAARRAHANRQAQRTTSLVVDQAAQTHLAMEQAAHQAQLQKMAVDPQPRQAVQQAPPPLTQADPGVTAQQAQLSQQFAALIDDFRFDSESQAVDGNPARRYMFRMQANITQSATVGPGVCDLSFTSSGAYMVERTSLSHAGTRENDIERVAQARIGGEVIGMNAADLRISETTQLHKAFNIYTFTAGDTQKITIYGVGGYMLRLYDVATAWGKACTR